MEISPKRAAFRVASARASGARLRHDASTLESNSGSLVLDLRSGKAVGLHTGFEGPYNEAIPAWEVAQRLERHVLG